MSNRRRKTFDIEEFKQFVNKAIELDKISEGEKKGLCSALEKVLHDSGNYRGYQHLGFRGERDDTSRIMPGGDLYWHRRYS